MPILNYVFTRVKDEEKLQSYIKAAGPLMVANGGEVLVRGTYLKSMFGEDQSPHITAVFRFPDMASAENFYTCPDYLALIPNRDEGGDITFDFYEE